MGSPHRYEDSGHNQDWSRFVQPVGTVKVLMIAQDFPDVPAKTRFSEIEKFASDMEREFYRLSYGRLDFEITLRDGWLRMPKTAKHYMASGDWEEKLHVALDLVRPEFNYVDFDMFIIKTDEKNVVVNVAGAMPLWPTRGDPNPWNGVYLGSDGWTQIGRGILVGIHEIGHVFGLPDLYMQNSDKSNPVGIFDLMGGGNENYPGAILGWNRWKLGWLGDQEISCLDPTKLQQFSISSSAQKLEPHVFPLTGNRSLVIEQWKPFSNKEARHLLAYTVDANLHVAAGAAEWGKVSPIQVLTPKGVKRSTEWGTFNYNLAINPGQSVETEIGTFKFVRGGKDLVMRFEPKGEFANDIAAPKLTTKRITLGAVANKSTKLSSTAARKADRELTRYPAQAVKCVATVARGASSQVVSRSNRLASDLCKDLKKKVPHLKISHTVAKSSASPNRTAVSIEVTY